MAVGLKLSGLREVQQGLKKYAKKYPAATGHAIYTEGFEIQREAQRRAPVEFAVLRTSAYTTVPDLKNVVAEVGFGTQYAVRQHEETTWHHPRGGEAKYLENAINMRSGGMLQRLRDYIMKLVERGVETLPAPMGNTRPVVKPAPKKARKNKLTSRPKAMPTKRQKPKRKG